MSFSQYGNVFVVISEKDSELSRDDVIAAYEKFIEGTKQVKRKEADRKTLSRLPEDKKYSTCTRQWIGHAKVPGLVNGKYTPLFVSEVIQWQ